MHADDGFDRMIAACNRSKTITSTARVNAP